jgi:hypothetical protein
VSATTSRHREESVRLASTSREEPRTQSSAEKSSNIEGRVTPPSRETGTSAAASNWTRTGLSFDVKVKVSSAFVTSTGS